MKHSVICYKIRIYSVKKSFTTLVEKENNYQSDIKKNLGIFQFAHAIYQVKVNIRDVQSEQHAYVHACCLIK